MLPLIVLPAALDVLASMGYPGAKSSSGFIVSKPPKVAPPLFWHQDGMLWDDPSSYTDEPVQVFLMYYLIDTDRENGCLRVIPGSPRRRRRLHGLPPAHGKEIATVSGDRPVPQPDPDEARLLHSAHPNRSDQRRTAVTLRFVPTYPDLPERFQAFSGKRSEGDGETPEGPSCAGCSLATVAQ